MLLGLLGVLCAPAAAAAPVDTLRNLPPTLQKYVPNSPAWNASPWMTAATCKDKGGDFAIWALNVANDTPALLAYFQSSAFGPTSPAVDKPMWDEVIQGYQTLARQVPAMMPPGAYCVNDLTQWAGADPAVKPFGFAWGVDPNHQSQYYCTDLVDPNQPASVDENKYLGAERAPCDGFYISCAAVPAAQQSACAAWDSFSDGYVKAVDDLRSRSTIDHPDAATAAPGRRMKSTGNSVPSGKVNPEFCPINQALCDTAGAAGTAVADSWFAGLTTTIVQGATSMLANSLTWWTTSDRSGMLQSPAITQIQGLLRYIGLVVLAGSIIWQGIQMLYRRKLDPLVTTGMGLLSFVGWSTLGGTLAVLLNEGGGALAQQVLSKSISDFANSVTGTMLGLVATQTAAVFFLAIILFLLAVIQWVLAFFRIGALVILLALLPTAAAGQLNDSTKPWLRKVLSWCLSLILYQPIVAVVYATGFELVGNGGSLSTVLVGLAVLALSVLSMPTMLRFFDWGGQKLVNGGGGGGAMAAGAAASMLGSGGAGAFGRFMDHNGPNSGRGDRDAGAAPVTSAHQGDDGSRDAGALPSPGGSGAGQGLSPATMGMPAGRGASGGASGAASGEAASAGIASGGAAGAGATVGAGAGAGAAGGAAAAAGPAGAAVAAGAGAAKGAVNAAAGAMTEGAGDSGVSG